MDIPLPSINEAELDKVQRPFELDMIAFYNVVKDDILQIIESGNYDSIDELAMQIDKLLQ